MKKNYLKEYQNLVTILLSDEKTNNCKKQADKLHTKIMKIMIKS